jgi:hypothetical protein
MPDDRETVAWQLGRPPRGSWRVSARCSFGAPTAIATAPALADGSPFPTLHYLTCPYLADELSRSESNGTLEVWRARLAAEPELEARLRAADASYREARLAEGGGADPCTGLGIAGQRDPLGVKCLHAHVATLLSGTPDPVGEGALQGHARECADGRCIRRDR